MSLLDRFRADPAVRLLRANPVLALPAHLASARVLDHAREWSPGAVPVGGGVVKVSDTVELHGPVAYDETLWRRAKLPAECTVVYAARELLPESLYAADTSAPYDLIAGLCDRIGGRYRTAARKSWEEPDTEPPDPWVYAPHMLTPDEMLDVLAPHVPGAQISRRAELTYYSVDADPLVIFVDAAYARINPLVTRQPWFSPDEPVTEYEIAVFENAHPQAGKVADAIADATGGTILAEYGFPWPRR